ncbi:START domain-containing protein [Polynucleobacter paneuropaeus]|uniref:START domain-containing protein n=1 Tax=Polynucleobacter paneuropaeus TaxID=2527775 RepID=UPI0032E89263
MRSAFARHLRHSFLFPSLQAAGTRATYHQRVDHTNHPENPNLASGVIRGAVKIQGCCIRHAPNPGVISPQYSYPQQTIFLEQQHIYLDFYLAKHPTTIRLIARH